MAEHPLVLKIADRIAREGRLPFRDFMEMALYDPEHGYYAAARAGIGRGGDYFTSVSVGPLFGELLGFQFREMWERLGRCEAFTIVEQGAYDGTFAADVLRWAREAAPDFFEALQYEIVESFPEPRGRQQERLVEFGGSVTWRDSLEELPAFEGVHFSNELIDAFPVHVVKYIDGEWHERHVGEKGWIDLPVRNAALAARLVALPRIEGYTTEMNLEAAAWAAKVSGKLRRGWVLAIDYGFPWEEYYAPARTEGTLQARAGHARRGDPLVDAGQVDLTAHVDFTSVAEAFLAHGLELSGYTDQHHFLVGITSRALEKPEPKQVRELNTLLHPEMLGVSFQVLLLSSGIAPAAEPLSGFRYTREAARELGL